MTKTYFYYKPIQSCCIAFEEWGFYYLDKVFADATLRLLREDSVVAVRV